MFVDPSRRVFTISGSDRFRFLQGLITQDLSLIEKGQSQVVYTALLSPNGRYQFDFFIVQYHDVLYVVSMDAENLLKRIQPYKLRLDITLLPLFATHHVYGSRLAISQGITFKDPRHPDLGYWCISDAELPTSDLYAHYLQRRFQLAIPDSEDFEKDRSIILEWGLEELHGISFTKGCYMGQELMSRTKHLGQIRKRILPCQLDDIHGPVHIGAKVVFFDQEIGEVKAVNQESALVLVRMDMIPIQQQSTVPVIIQQEKAMIYKPGWFSA